MAKSRKTKTRGQLDREIAEALAGLDRKILSAGLEGGELYWRGRSGRPVVKPHPRTSASCKACGRFHSVGEHGRHAGTSGPRPRPTKGTRAKPTRTREKKARGGEVAARRRDPLEVVREAVRSAPASDRFGDRKVFISRIWDRTRGDLGMTLGEFKRWLIDAHMARRLVMSRADLVAAMDPDLVAASSTIPDGQTFPEWHFIVDESR